MDNQAPTAFPEAIDARLPLTKASIDPSLHRMDIVTVSPKYQVVIPQRVREAIGLRSGQKVHVFPFRNRIEIIPVQDIRKLRGFAKGIDTAFVRDGDRV
jgi:AbrB family looped-hinge helix DNA binding protein